MNSQRKNSLLINVNQNIKQRLKEEAKRKETKKKERATIKEGRLIIGQLGTLLKSRLEAEEHDHHHHHHNQNH